MVKEHNQLFIAAMGILDLAVMLAAWLLCFHVRFHSGWFAFEEPVAPSLGYVSDVIVISLLLMIIIFGRFGMYMPRRLLLFRTEVFDILRACVVVWLATVVIGYFLRSSPVSRKLTGMFLVVWPAMMIAYRGAARTALRFARRHGRNIRSVAVVGAGRLGQKIFHVLRRRPWTGYHVRYFVSDQRIGERLLSVPVYGPVGEVSRIVEANPVDAVFVALPKDQGHRTAEILDKLAGNLVDVNVVPDLLSYQFLRHQVQLLGMLPIVNLTHSRQSGWNATAKRLVDVVFSLVAIVVLSPLFLAVAAAVKFTSSGRVFYRQKRASLGGREFRIIKFRSMVAGADRMNGSNWGSPKIDPRITPVGRILRKLSLDELPQLLNVLRGDMSLVGPRPEMPEFVDRFSRQVPRYVLRHHVKAGMTGWAQVHGFRGRTSLRKRIQYDLDYINRWSIAFDLWILVRTVFRGFVNRGN